MKKPNMSKIDKLSRGMPSTIKSISTKKIKTKNELSSIHIPIDLIDDYEFNDTLNSDIELVSDDLYADTSISSELEELVNLVKNSHTNIEYFDVESVLGICNAIKSIFNYINKVKADYSNNAGACKLRDNTLIRLNDIILSSDFYNIFGIDHFATMEFNSDIVEFLVDCIINASDYSCMAILNKVIEHTRLDDMKLQLSDGTNLKIPRTEIKGYAKSIEKSFVSKLSEDDLSKLYIDLQIDLFDLYVSSICLKYNINVLDYDNEYDKYVDMGYYHILRTFNLTKLDDVFFNFSIVDMYMIVEKLINKNVLLNN